MTEKEGEALEQLDGELWVASRPLPLAVGDIGTRMTVIRLEGGDLFLHSPVPLDDATKTAIDRLGTVRYVVGSNRFHHLFLSEYVKAYPKAELWGVPGLAEKRRDLDIHHVVGDESVEKLAGQIVPHLFGGFAGNEVVFFHPSSRSLLVSDLAFNVCKDGRNRARFFHWAVGATGRFGPHRLIRLGIRDRKAARRSLDLILKWDFGRVIVAHGEVLESGGRSAMEAAFAYLRS